LAILESTSDKANALYNYIYPDLLSYHKQHIYVHAQIYEFWTCKLLFKEKNQNMA